MSAGRACPEIWSEVGFKSVQDLFKTSTSVGIASVSSSISSTNRLHFELKDHSDPRHPGEILSGQYADQRKTGIGGIRELWEGSGEGSGQGSGQGAGQGAGQGSGEDPDRDV